MRHAGVFALVLTAGCSVLWNMDAYDSRSESSPRDSGSAPADATTDARAEAGSGAEAGADAEGVDATAACHAEIEPNDAEEQAHEAEPGTTCGTIANPDDEDYVKVTTPNAIDVIVALSPQVEVTIVGPTAGSLIDTPGVNKVTLEPGKTTFDFHSKIGDPGDYSIIR